MDSADATTLAALEARIDAMSHEEMARFWRFAPSSSPIVQTPALWARFERRFKEAGGWTPEISKRVGW